MIPFVAWCWDRFFGAMLACLVRRPIGGFAEPTDFPAHPEEIEYSVSPPTLTFQEVEPNTLWSFQGPSPVPSFWRESAMLHGRAMGQQGARCAVVILHGACEGEYTFLAKFGAAFARQGFRVLIPAAPCHLERTVKDTFSGAALFWSAKRFVTGMAQWLAEVRSLVDGLRQEGATQVGVFGYSLGSVAAGLAATIWPDLDFTVLLTPVGSHHQSILRSQIIGRMFWWLRKLPKEDADLFARWAPINRRPVVRRLLFLLAKYDHLQPTVMQYDQWRAWGQPSFHEYPHGHLSLLFSKQLFADVEQFAASVARS